MKKRILVSACLLGKNCRFNGGNSLIKALENVDIEWVPVCPEEEGGLGTPRAAAEMQADAEDIINNGESVININGKDVTEQFVNGAMVSLNKGIQNNIQIIAIQMYNN